MKLIYKILWIEDEKDWVESEIEFIEDFLETYGFILEYENPEKYEKNDFSNFDIIVVDYNLANGEKGTDVIKEIRSSELYTDILFYSSDGENKLRKMLTELDGIYCASKESCREKLKGLIKTTIKKTQDLNNLRGLVMAETSEIDKIMKEILLRVCTMNEISNSSFDICCSTNRTKKIEYNHFQKGHIFTLYSRETNNVNIIEKTSSYNLYLRIKDFLNSDLYNGEINIDNYDTEVRKDRILLAHFPENTSTNTTMEIKKDNGDIIPYDESKFIELRKNIQKYKKLFEEIRDSV